jgi:hypothetical protein
MPRPSSPVTTTNLGIRSFHVRILLLCNRVYLRVFHNTIFWVSALSLQFWVSGSSGISRKTLGRNKKLKMQGEASFCDTLDLSVFFSFAMSQINLA